MAKDPISFVLRIRSYENKGWVSAWIIALEGKTVISEQGILHGELWEPVAEKLIAAIGLPVEYEARPYNVGKPFDKPETIPVAKQRDLFGDIPDAEETPPAHEAKQGEKTTRKRKVQKPAQAEAAAPNAADDSGS